MSALNVGNLSLQPRLAYSKCSTLIRSIVFKNQCFLNEKKSLNTMNCPCSIIKFSHSTDVKAMRLSCGFNSSNIDKNSEPFPENNKMGEVWISKMKKLIFKKKDLEIIHNILEMQSQKRMQLSFGFSASELRYLRKICRKEFVKLVAHANIATDKNGVKGKRNQKIIVTPSLSSHSLDKSDFLSKKQVLATFILSSISISENSGFRIGSTEISDQIWANNRLGNYKMSVATWLFSTNKIIGNIVKTEDIRSFENKPGRIFELFSTWDTVFNNFLDLLGINHGFDIEINPGTMKAISTGAHTYAIEASLSMNDPQLAQMIYFVAFVLESYNSYRANDARVFWPTEFAVKVLVNPEDLDYKNSFRRSKAIVHHFDPQFILLVLKDFDRYSKSAPGELAGLRKICRKYLFKLYLKELRASNNFSKLFRVAISAIHSSRTSHNVINNHKFVEGCETNQHLDGSDFLMIARSLVKNSRLNQAKEIIELLHERKGTVGRDLVKLWNIYLLGLSNKNDLSALLLSLNNMVASGINTTKGTLLVVIRGCLRHKNRAALKIALKLYTSIKKRNQLNPSLVTVIVRGLFEEHQTAKAHKLGVKIFTSYFYTTDNNPKSFPLILESVNSAAICVFLEYHLYFKKIYPSSENFFNCLASKIISIEKYRLNNRLFLSLTKGLLANDRIFDCFELYTSVVRVNATPFKSSTHMITSKLTSLQLLSALEQNNMSWIRDSFDNTSTKLRLEKLFFELSYSTSLAKLDETKSTQCFNDVLNCDIFKGLLPWIYQNVPQNQHATAHMSVFQELIKFLNQQNESILDVVFSNIVRLFLNILELYPRHTEQRFKAPPLNSTTFLLLIREALKLNNIKAARMIWVKLEREDKLNIKLSSPRYHKILKKLRH